MSTIPADSTVFFQFKSEDWEGEFIDVKKDDDIQDHAVLRVVVEKPSPSKKLNLFKEASNYSSKLLKPNKREAEELSKLFPHTIRTSKKHGPSFDPNETLEGAPDKKKKRGSTSLGRCVNITICRLPHYSTFVPKGKVRNELKKQGRLVDIKLTRSMAATVVRQAINRAYHNLDTNWKYLSTRQDNGLSLAENQSPHGNALCTRTGCIYIYDTEIQSSDEELPLFNLPGTTTKQNDREESIEETRAIISRQNQEHEDSVRLDQTKALETKKRRERTEKLQALRVHLREKFAIHQPQVESSDQIKVAFRLPDSTKVLYEFVFSASDDNGLFVIYQSYPRAQIACSDLLTIADAGIQGLVIVEYSAPDGLVDPMTLLKEAAQEPEERMDCGDLDVLKQADAERIAFVQSLSLVYGVTHCVDRCTIFKDIVHLYSDDLKNVLGEYPFHTKFAGEKAIDVGGVTRDVFSAFFEEAYVMYFDGSSLLTPADYPVLDSQPSSTLGTIISHVYLITGMLPVKVAFPCLAAILLPSVNGLPDEILSRCFVDSLSNLDASCLRDGVLAVRAGDKHFKSDVQSSLIGVLSMFQVREIPTPKNLIQLVSGVARYHFLRKPAAVIAEMASGVPKTHKPFWSKMGCGGLYSVYSALQASPKKVLQMIQEVETANPNQERVSFYLRQYIGNMQVDEVRLFLRFVTGSAVCSANAIQVTFNTLTGLARRPIGHTCSNTIELPATYLSYLDFTTEFKAILNNPEFAWRMDGI